MVVSANRQFTIEATPEKILDVMMDVEALPEWSGAHHDATVLERDGHGRPLRSMSTMRMAGLTDEQVLEYVYPDSGFGWRLVSSRHLKKQDATYTLTPDGTRTQVKLHLIVVSAVGLPGFIMKRVVQAVVISATVDLTKRVRTVQDRPTH
jgi:hypothetical protein